MPLENSFDYTSAFHLWREILTLIATHDLILCFGLCPVEEVEFQLKPLYPAPATDFKGPIYSMGRFWGRSWEPVFLQLSLGTDTPMLTWRTLLFSGFEKQIKAANVTRLAAIGRPGSILRWFGFHCSATRYRCPESLEEFCGCLSWGHLLTDHLNLLILMDVMCGFIFNRPYEEKPKVFLQVMHLFLLPCFYVFLQVWFSPVLHNRCSEITHMMLF